MTLTELAVYGIEIPAVDELDEFELIETELYDTEEYLITDIEKEGE